MVGSCQGWQAGAQMPSSSSQALNRLSQSLEQPAPPQGERAWQRLPARGTQPVPAWLPRLPTFPRCHPPLPPPPGSAPGQCPGLLAQGRDVISLSPLGPQALGVPHYQQPKNPRKNKYGIRTITPKCSPCPCRLFPVPGRLDTQTPWLPAAALSPGTGADVQPVAPEAVWGCPQLWFLDSPEEGL